MLLVTVSMDTSAATNQLGPVHLLYTMKDQLKQHCHLFCIIIMQVVGTSTKSKTHKLLNLFAICSTDEPKILAFTELISLRLLLYIALLTEEVFLSIRHHRTNYKVIKKI